MVAYAVRRLIWFIPIILITLTVLFFLFQVVPGDPIRAAFGSEVPMDESQLAALRAQLGLDQPLIIRYFQYLWGLCHLNLGISFYTTATVAEELATRIPVTLGLVLLALLMIIVLSLPTGILTGYFHDRWPDWIIRPISILFIGLPSFWLALMVVLLMLTIWGFSVPLTYTTFFTDPVEALKQYTVPAAIMAVRGWAVSARMVRSSFIEIMEDDYIRTARSKGLTELLVTLRHALPNSLITVVTYYGLEILTLIGATVVIETVFGIAGIGGLVARAAQQNDMYVLQGGIMTLVLVALTVNLIVDLTYARLDPRIRYQ
jgi:peptide/nickel transport system permease protein